MKKFKFTNFIIILIILASLVFIYNLAGSVFDSRVNDMLIKFSAGKKKADISRIVLIAADDKSLDKFSFPPARDKFAQIFDFLENQAGAKAVIFNNLVACRVRRFDAPKIDCSLCFNPAIFRFLLPAVSTVSISLFSSVITF